jgi:Fe-S-cluster containining protein
MKNPQHILNTGILANDKTLAFFSSQYKCRRCGACCSGKLFGKVRLHPGEGPAIAKSLGDDIREFYRKYCISVNYLPYLYQPCPFLDDKPEGVSCRIYEARGRSCRVFPVARLVSGRLETIGIDMRCPAGAELVEEFKRQAENRKAELRKN